MAYRTTAPMESPRRAALLAVALLDKSHPGTDIDLGAVCADHVLRSAAPPRPLAAVPPFLTCRTFRGQASSVRQARSWLGRLLAGHPADDDAVLALSEFATNAVVHSRSRLPGGRFTVRAAISLDLVRIEVADDGGPWPGGLAWIGQPTADGTVPQHGRGLAIVAALTGAWGITGDELGRQAWCEIHANSGRRR